MAFLGKVIHISTLIFHQVAYLGGVIQIDIQLIVDNYAHNFACSIANINKKMNKQKRVYIFYAYS